jgi:hypothetical protein
MIWSNAGDTRSEMGARLIGHAPHIAPKAYVHVVYGPLGEAELHELTERLGRPVPSQYREFLKHANGLMLFSGAIRVMGYVPLNRRADRSVHNYPSHVVIPNVSARIRGLTHGAVIVGWYKEDGSYVSIEDDGRAIRFDARGHGGMLQEWPDFDTWLISEIVSRNSVALLKQKKKGFAQ